MGKTDCRVELILTFPATEANTVKVLIIGGTGLISTSITRPLLERGDDVTLYNRGKSEARIPEGAKTI